MKDIDALANFFARLWIVLAAGGITGVIVAIKAALRWWNR